MVMVLCPHVRASDIKQEDKMGTGEVSSEGKYYVAYYFHGNKRCSTCEKLESYSYEAVSSEKVHEASEVPVIWKVVNMDAPEYCHFTDDFDLYTQSLIIAEYSGESITRWKNLDEIWMLVRNKTDFLEYVTEEVCMFLRE